MIVPLSVCSVLLLYNSVSSTPGVLIIQDERPAMVTLAEQLQKRANIPSTIITQAEMPSDLGPYQAVLVYVHRNLEEPVEKALIDYANGGGRLVLLHHSISSGKRQNRYWFPFLGISLPTGDVGKGGYLYLDPASWEVVNLAPGNPVSTQGVKYDQKVLYHSPGSGNEVERAAFWLKDTEVYLNHVFIGPRKILLGLKYIDPVTGVTYMQDTAGWYKKAGKGWVMYFMAGHEAADFENDAYAQILANAVRMELNQVP